MRKRAVAALVIALGLAACDQALPSEAALPLEPANALAGVSDARMLDLSIALADARSRLLPAVAEQTERAAPLQAALAALDERLAAQDAAGVVEAAQAVDAALAALPAADAEAIAAELDALRLALGEVRETAAGPAELMQ